MEHMKEVFGQLEGNQKQLDAVVRDALDGKLITHEQQYRARQVLYFAQLSMQPPTKEAVDAAMAGASMTWRSRSEGVRQSPLPETLKPSPAAPPKFQSPRRPASPPTTPPAGTALRVHLPSTTGARSGSPQRSASPPSSRPVTLTATTREPRGSPSSVYR